MIKFKQRLLFLILLLLASFAVWAALDLTFNKNNEETVYAASSNDLLFGLSSSGETYSVKARRTDISGELVIPGTYNGKAVTTILSKGFADCTSLTSVIISDGITEIEENAFARCTGLKSVEIGNSVTSIGSNAFYHCPELTSVVVGSSVKRIGSYAFSECSLSEITIPESVISIGNGAFYGNTFEKIEIPYSVTSLSKSCLNNCNNLSEIIYGGLRSYWNTQSITTKATVHCADDDGYKFTISHNFSGYNNSDSTKNDVTVNYSGYKAGGFYDQSVHDYSSVSTYSFPSGETLSEEGYYRIEVRNGIFRPVTFKFRIDKTPPTGQLIGVTDGGYTKNNVTFSWNESSATATLNGAEYNSGASIASENAYTIKLVDLAGNISTYAFEIDRTAPVIEMSVSNGEHTANDVTVNCSDARSDVTSFYGRAETIDNPLPTVEFNPGYKFTSEGNYKVMARDLAGNVTEKKFTIDKTAPVIGDFSSYTNAAFTLSAEDKYSGIGAWEYRLNSGEIQRRKVQTITLGNGAESNGIWELRVIDNIGNTSKWVTVNFAYRDTFGNAEGIYNSFFVPSYYIVNLTQKNFASCFGSYTFADYVSALSFAISKEWECRVIELDGGRSWNYVNSTNENTRQIYTDRSELDSVIDKYAKKNISERKIIGKNGVVLNNPTDSNGVTRSDALTDQLSVLPGILSDYSEMRYMLAQSNYKLSTPKSIVDGNRSRATIQYLTDGISLRKGQEVDLEYGVSLDAALSSVIEQGWYLITERDVCGNLEKYLIFIDLQQPYIYANVKYGNGDKERINFNQSYVEENLEAMRFIEFDICSITDNIDDYVMVSIEGRNAGTRYIVGDELPLLNYENGYYGAYTITAYDRSQNVIEFTVYIAGDDPSLRHSSLSNETACTFTIQVNDSFNEITDIKFYKIHFDGTEERIYADTNDTPIDAQTLVYKMNVGGKYVFEFTDLYGRTVRTNPIFYMKGLPSATLRGVKDGGLTKNDVSIIYDTDVTCELYTFSSGNWIANENFIVTQGVSTYTMSITAGIESTAIYKILLYKTADRNLFTEYTFEIDGIPPEVQIFTESGIGVSPESVIIQSFYVTWQESGYKAYYKKQGALSEMQYSKDTVITSAGSYVFTIYDIARNEFTFNLTLDNFVSYTLEGTYTRLEGGGYITRNSFVFTVTEPFSEFNVAASNDLSIVNGQKLDIDGTYLISVKDIYGNAVELKLVVDKLPPVPVILTENNKELEIGSRTAKAFRLLCYEDNVSITYSLGNTGLKAYNGELLNDVGTYTFKLTDWIGNSINVSVTIDREVSYRIDGTYFEVDGKYYSGNWILIVPTETVSKFSIDTKDGESVDTTKRITEEGVYYVAISDMAGNEVSFTLVIDKTAPTLKVITESGKLSESSIVNEVFKVVCEEENIIISYSFEGSANVTYNGEWLTEEGKYLFTVKDKLGNSNTSEFVIDKTVNFRIDGNYTIIDDVYYSRTWLLVTPSEELTTLTIENALGEVIDTQTKITAEGLYAVTMIDVAGNKAWLSIVIDKTPPSATLVTESGNEFSNGSINEAFKVVCIEAGSTIEYSLNSGSYFNYNGGFITEEGFYTFRIKDRLGNANEMSVYLNYHVTFTVEGTYTLLNSTYYSKSWLLVVPKGDISNFIIEDEFGNLFDTNKRLATEGSYTAEITDISGNKVRLPLVIDKTAPEVSIETENGITLKTGYTTNEKFKVVCVELNSTLAYSYNGSANSAYNGEWLTQEGKYLFTVKDFLGNTSEVRITVDTSVSLIVNGTYVKDDDGNYISGNWLSVSSDETMQSFYILAQDGTNIDVNSRISVEGVYELYAKDMYGNELMQKLVIDKTAPIIALEGVDNGGVTNSVVSIYFTDFSEAYYRFNNGDKIILSEGSEFSAEGNYLITVHDVVGNIANASFAIDKHVDVVPSIELIDGCIITRSVSFKFNEDVTAKLYRANEEVTYLRGEIADQGEYRLVVIDVCKNERTFSWSILPAKAREYLIRVESNVNVVIERNGEVMILPFNDNVLNLTKTGLYLMLFDTGYSQWSLELEVDNVAPEVQIENTKRSVRIFNPSKEGVTYTLYRNGEKKTFNLKDFAELTQTGDYKLICEDELGNVTEYEFKLNYLSDVSIALIVVLSSLSIAAVVTVLVLRFKRKIF